MELLIFAIDRLKAFEPEEFKFQYGATNIRTWIQNSNGCGYLNSNMELLIYMEFEEHINKILKFKFQYGATNII